MKTPMKNPLLKNALLASLLGTLASHAGDPLPTGTTIIPASESRLSGTLNLDINSHFISYGADVWGDGDRFSEPAFNPSIELTWALADSLSFSLGTWWDVNSKAGSNSSPIGGRIQEIDVWYGLSYTFGDFTAGLVYNQWFYGSETEDTVDLSLSYDTFLSPSLTIHHRFDPGASGGDNGTVFVLGLSHDIEAGPVTISFPFNLAYFASDDFHGGDSGLGYGSIGVSASVPLSFISDAYGEWSFNAGLTYYVTDQDVIPGNVEGDFLTANFGISCSF